MEDPKLARVDPGPDSVVNPADQVKASAVAFVYSADPVAALVHTKVDHPKVDPAGDSGDPVAGESKTPPVAAEHLDQSAPSDRPLT